MPPSGSPPGILGRAVPPVGCCPDHVDAPRRRCRPGSRALRLGRRSPPGPPGRRPGAARAPGRLPESAQPGGVRRERGRRGPGLRPGLLDPGADAPGPRGGRVSDAEGPVPRKLGAAGVPRAHPPHGAGSARRWRGPASGSCSRSLPSCCSRPAPISGRRRCSSAPSSSPGSSGTPTCSCGSWGPRRSTGPICPLASPRCHPGGGRHHERGAGKTDGPPHPHARHARRARHGPGPSAGGCAIRACRCSDAAPDTLREAARAVQTIAYSELTDLRVRTTLRGAPSLVATDRTRST